VLFEFAAEDADSAKELVALIAKLEKDVTAGGDPNAAFGRNRR
jgi:hypothetical protein